MSTSALFGSNAHSVAHLEAEAEVLKQHMMTARGLYYTLVDSGTHQVGLENLEDSFGFTWQEQYVHISGQKQRRDPFQWKMLEVIMRDSLQVYLDNLDNSLCRVCGLEPSQLGAWVCKEMDQVRRSTWFHLSTLLLKRSTAKDDVIRLLEKLRDENLPAHVNAVKHRLKEQAKGVRALLSLASAEEDNLESVLQTTDHDLTMLVACPPKDLLTMLNERGIDLSEITSVYANSNGLVQGSSRILPPSMGVRADVVSRWLDRHKDVVSECCVACLGIIRRQVDLQVWTTYSWSGVSLCLSDWSDARTKKACEGQGKPLPYTVEPWVAPSHLQMPQQTSTRLIVYTGENVHMGVRCSRFFDILMQQTHLNLLPGATWRANVLVPVVSRVISETSKMWSQFVVAHGLGAGDDEHLASKRQRNVAPLETPGTVVVPTAAAVEAAASLSERIVMAQPVASKPASCVHPKLLRDHAIVNALCKCLQDALLSLNNVQIPPGDIVSTVRQIAPALTVATDHSLRQAVSHVCNKIVQWAQEKIKVDQTAPLHIAYSTERDRKADGKVSGVLASRDGGNYLLRFALTTVHRMAFDGPKFLQRWKPGRSSQARAASVARELGVKCGSRRSTLAKSIGSEENGP